MEALPRLTIAYRQPRAFRRVWLKYVTGFMPHVHCARCLVGRYSKLTHMWERRDVDNIALDEHPAPFIYFCAVTARYEWNIHLAGRPAIGPSVRYEDERILVEIDNLAQLAIVPGAGPSAPAAFETCRNWQFGWLAFPDTPRQQPLWGDAW